MKKIIVLLSIILLTGCGVKDTAEQKKIVVTNFPSYDFARAVMGSDEDIKLLIKPGTETHSYDPTTKDIIDIQEADIFIYVGGESEDWVTNILKSIDLSKVTVIRLMDIVEVYEEEEIVPGMIVEDDDHEHEEDDNHNHEHEEEYDEHIWTSLDNAIKMVKEINRVMSLVHPQNSDEYSINTNNYIEKINELDSEINDIVSHSLRKTLVFGDRFPFLYFARQYNLDYYAAFPGCSTNTEASMKTVANLIDKVKKENIPAIFYIELSNHNIAETIANATNTKTLLFHSLQNVTINEFNAGKTYIDIMKDNVKNLREALN